MEKIYVHCYVLDVIVKVRLDQSFENEHRENKFVM